ncbi:uncharacterized protein LOC111374453 [Olea europaea var. sylvestris]|uniref:uncharacterized protein LOC111374453 n=1 Tax=Olea europaea var. sylvestris TaxID=158386 RepID=UPI000C1D31AB|nr:uncharacterized protein LOC111374453 [Olea europaea var. sylvestris]
MTKLIVWDEIPMVNKYAFETLDKMLKYITECELPFGGKVIMCGGDFRQILSVVHRGTKDDIMKASLCNGTRLICREFNQNVILAEIGSGEYRGKQAQGQTLEFVALCLPELVFSHDQPVENIEHSASNLESIIAWSLEIKVEPSLISHFSNFNSSTIL